MMMPHYAIFGGTMRSAIEFPELPEITPAEPDWTLRVVPRQPSDRGLTRLGQRRIGTEDYQLFRTPVGFRLEYSHAGVFEFNVTSRAILWYERMGVPLELVRSIVIGPIMALALEHTGMLCLHASGVATPTGAVAFIGPKHHGKSTTALAFTAAGARLIADDMIAIAPGTPPTVRSGIPTMRLWEDCARTLAVDQLCATVIPGLKHTVGGFSTDAVATGATPLCAVYLLQPVRAGNAGHAAQRQLLQGAAAVIAIAQQRKLADTLVGFSAAGTQLKIAAGICRTVPVYTLRIVRDYAVLDAVVRQLMAWHGESAATPASLQHDSSD